MTSPTDETLYSMLQAQRFDAIPLGLNEVDDELGKHADLNLMVEPNLALCYPAPVFFFVAPNYIALARRLEAGLQRMLCSTTSRKANWTINRMAI